MKWIISHNLNVSKNKNNKMVSGVYFLGKISDWYQFMVLFILIFTSVICSRIWGNAIADNEEVSGSAGFLLALCMLVAGIAEVAGRKSKKASIVTGW